MLSKLDFIYKYNDIYLIDLENKPNFCKLMNYNRKKICIIGVVSHTSHLATKETVFPKYVFKSAVKDASDHAISCLVGLLCNMMLDEQTLHIVTKDHFGECCVCFGKDLNISVKYHPMMNYKELNRDLK